MKKYLMGLSILIFCASAYGEVIDLGEKNIYSETGFEKNLRNSTTSPFIITSKDIETKGYTSVSEVLDSSVILRSSYRIFDEMEVLKEKLNKIENK